MTSEEMRIKKGHITLMKNPATALYSGVFLAGTNEVTEGKYTAYTDGVNKKYSRSFLKGIKEEPKLRGLILHENLHVALKHLLIGKSMFKENPKLANMAADFVVNGIIMDIDAKTTTGERLVDLPDGGLYHPMFKDWSFRQVYDYLKANCKGGGDGKGNNPSPHGKGDSGGQGEESESGSGGSVEVDIEGKTFSPETLDEHDFSTDLDGDEAKKISDDINKALREGGMLAGRLGAKVPRAISDVLEPKVDWRHVLKDFVTSATKGKDEFTWRKLNKRQMANDIYMPSVEDETVGEIIVAIDTSGSIGGRELSAFASELASICETVSPDKVRVLWWDTEVHGEQVFQDNYQAITSLLKPKGGGGTRVSCVSEWLEKHPKVDAECVIVFTDGYLENKIVWTVTKPTLWMVTQNHNFNVPSGKKVFVERD